MKPEEAIAVFDKILKRYAWVEDSKSVQAIKLAKECIEKQIPKNPTKDEYGYYVCSFCGADDYALMHDSIIANKYNFCHNCGQALDWSEEE